MKSAVRLRLRRLLRGLNGTGDRDGRRVVPWLTVGLAAMMLAGCQAFPHDGPSIDAVRQDAGGGHYSLVDLDARSAAIVGATPSQALDVLGPVSSTARIDQIGPGDGLSVTVYERGANTLFSSTSSINGDERPGSNTIPLLVVDRAGDIEMPFGGAVRVAGLTMTQAARAIEASLKGKAIAPQIVVAIKENVSNSVTVIGEVRNPGRYPLAEGGDRLLDIVALAAGPTKPADDIRVEVSRGPVAASATLAQVLKNDGQNVRLAPRDQVQLVYRPRKFSTFGALGQAALIPIEDETETLAAALSRTGGLDANSADAASVLLFRFERPEVAAALGVTAAPSPKGVPIIYHLDLRNPEGLFIANRFEIEPDDLIYVPRARLAELQQFINVVNSATAVAYNIRVTSVIAP